MAFARFSDYEQQQQLLAEQRQALDPAEPPRLLPDEKLALLLARLQIEAEPVTGEGAHLVPLPEAVNAFFTRHAGASGLALSPVQAERLAILDDLFSHLAEPDELAPGLLKAIAALRVVLARLALAGGDPFADVAEPGRALLEFVVRAGRGWDHHAGRKAEALPMQFEATARRLAMAPALSGAMCTEALGELAGFLQTFTAEARAIEQRLVAAERGAVRQQDARLFVAELMGNSLAGRALPEILLIFLAEIWSKYLHTVFLRDGLDSEAWKAAVAEIDAIVAVAEGDASDIRAYASQAFTTLGRVRDAIAAIHHNLEISNRFFADLEALVLARMEQREPGLPLAEAQLPATTLAPPPLGEGDRNALRLARSLRAGDWLVLNVGGSDVRCKVADKDMAHGYVLLTNYSGVRVAKRELNQLAQELAEGSARIVSRAPVFDAALTVIEAGCERRLYAAKQALVAALEAREAERARQLAAELAAEQARQAELKAQRAAEARAAAEREARARAYQESLMEVRQLQAGGWVELPEAEDGKRVQAKLALVMASTRKLVFVNRQGQRLAEMTQEQLAELMADGRAAIVHFGVAFEQTLATLVQTRREQLAE